MRSWSWIGCTVIALGVAAAYAPAQASVCGHFTHVSSDCYGAGGGDVDASISWLAHIDIGCSDHTVRIERRCGTGAWTTVAAAVDPGATPYIDEDPCCGQATQYRIRVECSGCAPGYGDWHNTTTDMCGCVGGGD